MTDTTERILDEAADWLLRITEKPGDRSARAGLEQWLAADPRHAEVWKELNRSYDMIGATEPVLVDRWQNGQAPVHSPRWLRRRDASRRNAGRPRSERRLGRVAAAAAAIALLTIWGAPSAWIALRADHRTGTAELETVNLADGSTAQLGPGSAIRIRYENGERRIELLAGQALFEVQPDKARPFRVMAGEVTATVLGTAFDVRRMPGATEVGVQHGRVRVDSATLIGEPVILGPGDRVAVDEGGQARKDHGSPLLIAAWAHGEVNARDRTVAQVIDDIRPWYGGRIIVANDEIATKRVNGVFDPSDPAAAIRSMVAPIGGTVTEITPWVILIAG